MYSKILLQRLNRQEFRIRRRRNVSLFITAVLLLAGCDSGADNSDSTKVASPYQGVWKVDYDVLRDECGLLEEGKTTLADIQTVNQTDSQLVLTSQEISKNEYTGEVRRDGSLEVAASQKGNLYNNGVNCSLEEALAYNNHFENEVSSLYDLRLKCDDGFYCVTALRGTGVAVVK
jgi:hypothetical protein